MGFIDWVRLQWDRVGAWVCIGVGALVLLLGYIGVSGTPYTSEQLPYIISGGLTGIFLLGIGGMLWLSADLRDEWRKLDNLDESLQAHTKAIESAAANAVELPPAPRARAASRSRARGGA
jgi:hypothetical protein